MIPIITIIVLIFSIILHELAHGAIAFLFGDPTAKQAGRLTLNPIPHIDILGSILLPAMFFISGSPIMIGWAKPVPVDPRYFKNPIQDMMWVGLSGPLTNISIAVICSLLLRGFAPVYNPTQFWMTIIIYILIISIKINLILAIFNLIPIPPLDGSRVLIFFVPNHAKDFLERLEPFGFLIIFLLAYMNFLDPIFRLFLEPLLKFFIPTL